MDGLNGPELPDSDSAHDITDLLPTSRKHVPTTSLPSRASGLPSGLESLKRSGIFHVRMNHSGSYVEVTVEHANLTKSFGKAVVQPFLAATVPQHRLSSVRAIEIHGVPVQLSSPTLTFVRLPSVSHIPVPVELTIDDARSPASPRTSVAHRRSSWPPMLQGVQRLLRSSHGEAATVTVLGEPIMPEGAQTALLASSGGGSGSGSGDLDVVPAIAADPVADHTMPMGHDMSHGMGHGMGHTLESAEQPPAYERAPNSKQPLTYV